MAGYLPGAAEVVSQTLLSKHPTAQDALSAEHAVAQSRKAEASLQKLIAQHAGSEKIMAQQLKEEQKKHEEQRKIISEQAQALREAISELKQLGKKSEDQQEIILEQAQALREAVNELKQLGEKLPLAKDDFSEKVAEEGLAAKTDLLDKMLAERKEVEKQVEEKAAAEQIEELPLAKDDFSERVAEECLAAKTDLVDKVAAERFDASHEDSPQPSDNPLRSRPIIPPGIRPWGIVSPPVAEKQLEEKAAAEQVEARSKSIPTKHIATKLKTKGSTNRPPAERTVIREAVDTLKAKGSANKPLAERAPPAERTVIQEEVHAVPKALAIALEHHNVAAIRASLRNAEEAALKASYQLLKAETQRITFLEFQKFREAVATLSATVKAAEERVRQVEEVAAACRDAHAGDSAQCAIKLWMTKCVRRIEESVWLSLEARMEEKLKVLLHSIS
jgi:hypothetical protein